MVYSSDRLEERRRAALDSRNAVQYFTLCNDLGIGDHSIEDFNLYERGQLESGNDSFAEGSAGDSFAVADDKPLRYAVAEVASVALLRFPELERGESIGIAEIRKKLGAIRKAGYPVKPYSQLKKEEAWAYLHEIRNEVARDGRKHCPKVLEEITRINESRRLDARN